MADPEAAIAIRAKHNPLAVLLLLTKFVIDVDGAEQNAPWGERRATVTPGEHTVRMPFRYLGRKCGAAEVSISAAPAATTSISYRAPVFMCSPGKTKWSSNRAWSAASRQARR